MLRRKTVARPTMEDRVAEAHARHNGALGLFEQVALELDDASRAHNEIANDAAQQQERFRLICQDTGQAAMLAERQAQKIRELFG